MKERNQVVHNFEGCDEYFDVEEAISQLLQDGVLFANSRKYLCPFSKELQRETVVLFVNANDVFAWASADIVEIKLKEVRALYDAHIASEIWGSTMWCAKKDDLKPQWLMAKDMIEQGAWDEEMEALSEEGAYMWDCEEALNRKDKWASAS